MTYVLPEKLKDLNPYDPVTEDFRIHLDANESFCEVPENIRQEILNAISNVAFNRYPDPYARKLCEKAGAYYHVDPKLLTAGNGSDELISLVVPYFLDEGDTMLVAVPDFSMYWFYAPFHKIKVESLQKENSMKTSAEEILQRAKEKNAKLLIFSNPCNPTSLGIGRDDIIKIIEGTDALVIVDEAYMEFEKESNSVLNEVENYDNLIVLKTCSKAFGMAAIRLGIAVTNEKLTGILHAIKAPYNVNSVTQAIGCVLFSHPEYLASCIDALKASRDELYQAVKAMEDKKTEIETVYETSTNFIFMKVKRAKEVFEALKQRGISIRFMNGYLRVTAGTKAENKEVMEALWELIQ